MCQTLQLNSEIGIPISDILIGLPRLCGSPICVSAQPVLTAHRGKLLSQTPHLGTPVHAATFIRKRRIVLESQLLANPDLLRLIVTHEIFHFVWVRLGNPARTQFEALLEFELARHARGELGESSAVKKESLETPGHVRSRSLRWRDYVCESFCDTAAWLYSGIAQNDAFTLAQRWRLRRKKWFSSELSSSCRC